MNTSTGIFLKVLLVTVAVFAGQMVIGGLVFGLMGPVWENPPPFSETVLPMFVGTLITVAVLVYPAMHSSLSGWRLFLALFLALFGLNVLLLNIEGALFLFITPEQLTSIVLMSTLANALLAALMVYAFGREPVAADPTGEKQHSAVKWGLRILLVAICYMLLYFTAGLLIIPYVKEFYETQHIPAGAWFIPFQVLRGLGYVLFTLYLVRSIVCSRWRCSLSMGLLFPVIAGVAGLLSPNGIMPDHVRYWHMLEIGWSNLVFGMVVGWVFWNGGVTGKVAAD
jgi:hypothetical protein